MCQAIPIWLGRANLTTMLPSLHGLSTTSYYFPPCNVIYIIGKKRSKPFRKHTLCNSSFWWILIIIWPTVIKMSFIVSPSTPNHKSHWKVQEVNSAPEYISPSLNYAWVWYEMRETWQVWLWPIQLGHALDLVLVLARIKVLLGLLIIVLVIVWVNRVPNWQ